MLKTRTINVLDKALQGSSVTQTVISNNIANVNTPGYKKNCVSFQKQLEKVIEKERPLITKNSKHFDISNIDKDDFIQVYQNQETSLRNDGNNVDVDLELTKLAENSLYFDSLTRLLSLQINMLKHSISEGRR